jgi:hypothetical protein
MKNRSVKQCFLFFKITTNGAISKSFPKILYQPPKTIFLAGRNDADHPDTLRVSRKFKYKKSNILKLEVPNYLKLFAIFFSSSPYKIYANFSIIMIFKPHKNFKFWPHATKTDPTRRPHRRQPDHPLQKTSRVSKKCVS